MIYLILVSCIWAFSFGLTKNIIAGLDPNFVSFFRLAISMLVFLPFLRLRGLSKRQMFLFVLIGAVEYGVMYLAYNAAFQYLKAYEVALFTIFTPLYVTLIHDLTARRLQVLPLAAVLVATLGAAVVRWDHIPAVTLAGFFLVQLSNLGFAVGLVWYRRQMEKESGLADAGVTGLLFLGGALLSGLFCGYSLLQGVQIRLTLPVLITLLYLGAVASGLGFFLWNVGSRRVSVGAMAIFNDLKIPLAVVVSLIFFKEQANLLQLALGSALVIGALLLNEYGPKMRRAVSPPPC